MISFIKSTIIFLNTNNIKQARPISAKVMPVWCPIIENTLFSKFAFSYMPSVNGKSHDKPDDSRQKIYLPDDWIITVTAIRDPAIFPSCCGRQSKHTSMKGSMCILDKCWIKWWIKTDYEAARKKLACCTPKNIIENRLQYRDGTCNSNYHGKIISNIPSKTSPQSRR